MPATPIEFGAYAAGLQKIMRGLVPIQTPGELKLLMVGADYVPNNESHTNVTHVTAYELYGDEWPQGGVTLTGCDMLIDPVDNKVYFAWSPVAVERASFAGGDKLVIYHASPGSAANRTLLVWGAFGQALSPVWGPVAIAAPDGAWGVGY